MSALPTGTVTLLFTDIEGSTRLWEQQPDAMTAALERHDELLRSTIESAGGYVFKTVGDAFCAAFAAAREAVGAAAAAQRALQDETWPEPVKLRVRMALHTGESDERDGDYFGPAVNRTARLEAIGHGGQVLVSRSTADLVRDRLTPGVQLINLGSHLLKDLDRPEEVFQLVVDGVPAAFPPLRSTSELEVPVVRSNPTNLSQAVSSFIGRDAEVTQVVNLLNGSRLVTLAGSGGVGKTRLATEVGRLLLDNITDGVWLVELASVSNPDLVAAEVQRDLGIAEQSGKEALDTLVEMLAGQSRLVILDNCEQVLDGCAVVAETLVRHCPDIKLLSTSREPLRIDGEIIYRVPSLSLPPEQVEDARDLAGSGAVALFVERAVAQKSDFKVSDNDAPLVASICRRLDGVPLALELATARLGSMSLVQLHDRLEHRFGMLTGGRRTALPRQQTLAATVDWSYDLLSEPEKALFRRASVFVDGFDLEAAEGVCTLSDNAEWEIADHLASLVNKSLVVAESHGDGLRYRLQETLRQYGNERLGETIAIEDTMAEAELVADAHADYYLTFAEQSEASLQGREVGARLAQLDTEDLNLRAAIEHALATPEGADLVLRQFWSAQRYWRESRHPARALHLLNRALDRFGPDLPVVRQAQALYCKAGVLYRVDRRLQLEVISAALDLARAAADKFLEADTLAAYSQCLADNGRNGEAMTVGADAMLLARGIGDPLLLGVVLRFCGTTLLLAGDSRAEVIFLEGLELTERTGDAFTEQVLHNNYALVLVGMSNFAEARRHLEISLKMMSSELSARTVNEYSNLATVMLQEGDARRAQSILVDGLRFCRLNGIVGIIPYVTLPLACCATMLDMPERAAVLHGGADALLTSVADFWEPLEAGIRARDIAILRERLGEEYERLYAEGVSMPHDKIIKLALG